MGVCISHETELHQFDRRSESVDWYLDHGRIAFRVKLQQDAATFIREYTSHKDGHVVDDDFTVAVTYE